MNRAALLFWPVLLVASLAACLLTGCTAVQVAWYRCDYAGFKGWDYERECVRLVGTAR